MVNIFDVDYTILKKPTTWYFLREALSEKVIRYSQIRRLPIEWIFYRLGLPNFDFIEQAVRHIAGIEKKTLETLADTCFERKMKAGIFCEAIRLIEEMKKRGEKVFFATSSFGIIIKPLEKFLKVDGSISSVLEFSDEKTTGRIVGSSLFGPKKKDTVEAWLKENRIDPGDVRFYSDSYTDLPLLNYSGEAIAVNPDRFLKREAKKRGWKILRFDKTLNNKGQRFHQHVSFGKAQLKELK